MAAELRPPDPKIDGSVGAPQSAGNWSRSFANVVGSSSISHQPNKRVLPPLSYNPRSFVEKDGIPMVKFSQEEIRAMENQFSTTVIAKFSAGRPTMAKICEVISNEWGLAEPASVCLVDPRHVLIHLKSQADCTKALARETNVMEKALYRVFRWDPDFNPRHESVRLATWVRLPGLPTKFFNPDTLAVIGNSIGDFLRVDTRTNNFTFAMYARLCVEIDVTKPRKEKIWISTGGENGFFQRVIFESKLLYCSKCGLHGHDISICRKALGPKNSSIQEQAPVSGQIKETNANTSNKTENSITFTNPTTIEKIGRAWRFVEKGNPQPQKNPTIPTISVASPFAILENLDEEENQANPAVNNIEDHSKEHEVEAISTPPSDMTKQPEDLLQQNPSDSLQSTKSHLLELPLSRQNIGKSKEYHGEDVAAVEIPLFLHKEAESLISNINQPAVALETLKDKSKDFNTSVAEVDAVVVKKGGTGKKKKGFPVNRTTDERPKYRASRSYRGSYPSFEDSRDDYIDDEDWL